MRIRAAHLWWLGVALFTPSVLMWATTIFLFVYQGIAVTPFDWDGIVRAYLPMFAALLGFTAPLVCFRRLKSASVAVNASAFAAYLFVMLGWGVLDVQHQHYQVGTHEFPNGIFADGHTHYRHLYYTWYFIPYRWIEQPISP